MTYHYASGPLLPKILLKITIAIGICTVLCVEARAQAAADTSAAPAASGRPDTLHIEEIEINTGYQRIPKERVTGSFVFVDSALLNRTVSTDILSRLEGVVGGLLFDKGRTNEQNLSIRGPSSLSQGGSPPLIILDNFEYNGDLRNINPNDIAGVTVLRDAAAASIWGAKAGNGVIVITTKSGKAGQRSKLSFSSNLSVRDRPDFSPTRPVSSDDFIDLEMFLFEQGYYRNTLTNISKPAVSPVVWILHQLEREQLTEGEAMARIDAFRGLDAMGELERWFYQPSFAQQHTVSLTGGSVANQHYASVGWDKNRSSSVGAGYERLTVNLNNTYRMAGDRLKFSGGLLYTRAEDEQNDHPPVFNYPYARFADDDGSALSIDRYNRGFLDTVGGGRLLDWEYRPLDELRHADNRTVTTDLKLNVSAQYQPFPWLTAQVRYQYGNGSRDLRNHYAQESFFTRDLINQFSSISGSGAVTRPIPLGGIVEETATDYVAHHARAQLDADKAWGRHAVTAMAGWQLSEENTVSHSGRRYGFNEDRYTQQVVNLVSPHASMVTGRANLIIPNGFGLRHLTDRFISFYGNASYAFAGRHTLTLSARKDASNLFGVRANQQWTPLWSVGYKWALDREPFFQLDWVPSLQLRATYGKSGNVDRSVTAFLVARVTTTNNYNQPALTIANPPNPDLQWETVATTNLAVDFALTPTRRISGSVELYRKSAADLMGNAELPPSSGLRSYRGNTASMTARGVDVSLRTRNTTGVVRWNTDLLYSYASNQVTEYRVEPAAVTGYFTGAYQVGNPVASLFAYRWAGLNPENGNPRGYLDGEVSENYNGFTTSTDLGDIRFVGSLVPTHFGGIRNTIDWERFSFSFNITVKLGYHFRANSLQYGQLFSGSFRTAPDYAARWQQPGDELQTDVPSLVYPALAARDQFYQYADVLALRADHIRLQDVRLDYRTRSRYPITVFAVSNNVGLLWRANTRDVDPDHRSQRPVPSIACGFTLLL